MQEYWVGCYPVAREMVWTRITSLYLNNELVDLFVHFLGVILHSHFVAFLYFLKDVFHLPCPPHLVTSQDHHALVTQHPVNSTYNKDYTILCAFSLVVDRDLLKDTHTHRWRQIHVKSCTSDHVSGLVSLFSCPKILQ